MIELFRDPSTFGPKFKHHKTKVLLPLLLLELVVLAVHNGYLLNLIIRGRNSRFRLPNCPWDPEHQHATGNGVFVFAERCLLRAQHHDITQDKLFM